MTDVREPALTPSAKSERADSPGKGRLQLALWQLNLLRVGTS